MKFSRRQIGQELKNELAKGYDIERISNWAFKLATNIPEDKDILNLLNCLCIMPGGSEYEYTEEELKTVSELLLNEEKNPIKIIDEMRTEKKTENALDIREKLMRFPKRYIGEELKNKLAGKFNIDQISNWAYELSIESRGEVSREVFDVLNSLCLMEMGSEFEYTKEELKKLSELLINEEKDPIKIIDRIRFGTPTEDRS